MSKKIGKIVSATVHSFNNGKGKKFGFAKTDNGAEVFLPARTYRRPEMAGREVEFLRIPATLPVSVKPGDRIRVVWVLPDDAGPFAVAWCLEDDLAAEIKKQAARDIPIEAEAERLELETRWPNENAKKVAAARVFGEEIISRFPQLLDHAGIVKFSGVSAKISTRRMPPKKLAEPKSPLRKGQTENWVIILDGPLGTRVLVLHGPGQLRERLMLQSVVFGDGANVPSGVDQMVVIRIVESISSLDVFIFTHNLPADSREETKVA